ncbi:MAG: hypothetical protein V1933_05670 [Candidatus Omnitrophota bacterium]
MKYIEFAEALKKNRLFIFSLRDAENLFAGEKHKTTKNNLGRWVRMGRLLKLKRDLYEFNDFGLASNIPDACIANKLYTPSYVSLHTALSIYGIIPEIAAAVISLTTRPTRTFRNKYGVFFYRSCQPRAFTGYRLMPYEGTKILIADPEKAMTDFIYFSHRGKETLDFEQERFSRVALRKFDWQKALGYARLFNRKTVTTVKRLKEWTKC